MYEEKGGHDLRFFTKERIYPGVIFTQLDDFSLYEGQMEEEDIIRISQEEKDHFLEELEKEYNTSPVEDQENALREMGTDLEDIKIWDYDEDGQPINERSPRDLEEFRAYLEKGLEEEMKIFEAREDFDRDFYEGFFEEIVDKNALFFEKVMPSYVLETVDSRLLGLFHMSEAIHNKLEEDLEAKIDELEDLDDEYDAYLEEEDIEEELIDKLLNLYEDKIAYMAEDGATMTLEGFDLVDELIVTRTLSFENPRIIENELNSLEGLEEYEIMEKEILRSGDAYEFGLLLEKMGRLYYLTIGFDSVDIEDEEI